MFERQWLKIS